MRAGRALFVLLFAFGLLFRAAAGSAGQDPAKEHRAAFPRLPAPTELLYLPERFDVCLGCHGRAMAEDEDFNVDTGFRDTSLGKNLHWMHIFRQPQGTNCTACHRLDGETGSIRFVEPAGVQVTERGGSCEPSCHRPKEYRNASRPKGNPTGPGGTR